MLLPGVRSCMIAENGNAAFAPRALGMLQAFIFHMTERCGFCYEVYEDAWVWK